MSATATPRVRIRGLKAVAASRPRRLYGLSVAALAAVALAVLSLVAFQGVAARDASTSSLSCVLASGQKCLPPQVLSAQAGAGLEPVLVAGSAVCLVFVHALRRRHQSPPARQECGDVRGSRSGEHVVPRAVGPGVVAHARTQAGRVGTRHLRLVECQESPHWPLHDRAHQRASDSRGWGAGA